MFDARADLSVVSGHLWAKRGAWGPPGHPKQPPGLGFHFLCQFSTQDAFQYLPFEMFFLFLSFWGALM